MLDLPVASFIPLLSNKGAVSVGTSLKHTMFKVNNASQPCQGLRGNDHLCVAVIDVAAESGAADYLHVPRNISQSAQINTCIVIYTRLVLADPVSGEE